MDRAHRSLWVLTALTVLAAGLVAQLLAARAGVITDVLLAASTVLLAASAALLIRVLRHITGLAHRHSGPPEGGQGERASRR